jgi:carbonic anhydrase
LKDVYAAQRHCFTEIKTEQERINLLCELNVKAQVANVCHTNVVQNAWERGQSLDVHGWIYGVGDGLLHDLKVTVSGSEQIDAAYRIIGSQGPQPGSQ